MPGSLVDFDFDWDLKISGISRVSLRNHTEDSRLRLWTGVSVLFQILMVAKMLAYILINDNEVNMILADHVVLFGPNLLKIRIFYFLSFISGLLLLAALVEINDQRRHASWFRLYFEPLDSELNKYFSTKDWEEMKTELSKVIKFNHYSNLYFFWPLHSILYFWTLFKMDLPTRIAINGLCGVTNAISYYFFIRSIEYSQFLFLTMNIVFKYQLASIAKVLEGRQGFAEVDIRNLEKVVQLYKQHNDASAVINKLLGYNLAFGFLISTISLYIAFFDDLPLQSRIIFFSLVLASNSHMILFPHLSCITIHEPVSPSLHDLADHS